MVKSPRVIICGSYGLGNPGDEAILSCIIWAFKMRLTHVDLVILSLNPTYTSSHQGVKAVSNLSLRIAEKLSLLRKSHLFILGGGGLIQDYTSILNIPFWMSNLYFAQRTGMPTMLYGVGVEPTQLTFSRRLVTKLLDRVSVITVRDEESAKLLKSWGLRNEIHSTADPAWGLKYLEDSEANRFHEPQVNKKLHNDAYMHKPVIGISLRQWLDLDFSIPKYFFPFKHELYGRSLPTSSKANKFLNMMARLADALITCINARIVVLPLWQKADRAICVSFLQRIRHKQQVHLIQDQCSPLELVEAIRNMDAFIGMRLHSLLFAAISRTPFITLTYSPKVKAFMNQLGQADLSFPIDYLERKESLESLVGVISDLIQRREKIGRELEDRTTTLAARSLMNAFHAVKLLDEL